MYCQVISMKHLQSAQISVWQLRKVIACEAVHLDKLSTAKKKTLLHQFSVWTLLLSSFPRTKLARKIFSKSWPRRKPCPTLPSMLQQKRINPRKKVWVTWYHTVSFDRAGRGCWKHRCSCRTRKLSTNEKKIDQCLLDEPKRHRPRCFSPADGKWNPRPKCEDQIYR